MLQLWLLKDYSQVLRWHKINNLFCILNNNLYITPDVKTNYRKSKMTNYLETKKQEAVTLCKDENYRKLFYSYALNNGWSKEELESLSKKQRALMLFYHANKFLDTLTETQKEKTLAKASV